MEFVVTDNSQFKIEMAALSEEVARAVSLHYKENFSVFPRCLCFPHRWLHFSKIDDGALFRCDLLGGDFLLGLCSNKVFLVSDFVACLTN